MASRGGRPTKYSKERVAQILDAVEKGATYEIAAGAAGISYQTLNEWRKDKPEFSEQLAAAEGRAGLKWLGRIEQAADQGTWQAASWLLERRFPHQYGKTVQDVNAKVSGELGLTVVITERPDGPQ